MDRSQELVNARMCRVKCRKPRPGQRFVRACAVEMNVDIEFSCQIRQTKIKQNPRRRFCACLRSGNAHGHVTRTILRENLQEKRRQEAPNSAGQKARNINIFMCRISDQNSYQRHFTAYTKIEKDLLYQDFRRFSYQNFL